LAEDGTSKCRVHQQGYHVHNTAHELRCWKCRRKIERGELYVQTNGADVRHARPCKLHPDVAAERQRRNKAMGAR
jgi:hypothetical protein